MQYGRRYSPMTHPLTVQLSDAAYSGLKLRAQAASRTPTELAAAALEQQFAASEGTFTDERPVTEAERKAARERFERHFGAVNLGRATGADNEGIDADLARSYGDAHEAG